MLVASTFGGSLGEGLGGRNSVSGPAGASLADVVRGSLTGIAQGRVGTTPFSFLDDERGATMTDSREGGVGTHVQAVCPGAWLSWPLTDGSVPWLVSIESGCAAVCLAESMPVSGSSSGGWNGREAVLVCRERSGMPFSWSTTRTVPSQSPS
jgi:hypothetical protein